MALTPQTRRRIFFGAVTAIVLTAGVLLLILPRAPRQLRFVALDVGQGDALFIESPDGKQMLIDGGPSNTVLSKLGRAMPLFDRSFDVVLMTHPDADHITGLIEVVRQYQVGMFITTGVQSSSAVYATLLKELHDKDVPIHYAIAGETVPLGSSVAYSILWPEEFWQGKSTKDTNDTSIVGRLTYGSFSVLTTGDASTTVERTLVRQHTPLQSTVLKAGHHGSRTATSEEFFSAVHPESVILSVGEKNRYGHPHKEILDLFAQTKTTTYRTDQQGDILFFSEGKTSTVHFGLGFRLR